MDHKVRINIWNENNEIESQKEFTAIEMRSAKAQATKWMNNNMDLEGMKLTKDEVTPRYHKWSIE